MTDTLNALDRLAHNGQTKDSEVKSSQQKTNTEVNSLSKKDEKESKRKFPFFLDEAEKIPFSKQSEIANYKRAIHNDLTPENLVWAEGIEITNFELREGVVRKMLKVKLQNGAAAYVPQNQAGENYRRMEVFLGQTFKVSITTFLKTETYDSDGRPEWIALASIYQAEFTLAGVQYRDFLKDKDKVTSETHVGTITRVIDIPFGLRMVFFAYDGMLLGMMGNNFYYQNYVHPLSEVATVGDTFKFKITNIEKKKFSDLATVKKDSTDPHWENEIPKGDYYEINTSALDFRENPDDKVRKLQQDRTEFIANIVNYNPVLGIIVQIAPGWLIKGRLNVNSRLKPSIYDAQHHTPVIVKIINLDFKHRRGSCWINSFPKGVYKSIDNNI